MTDGPTSYVALAGEFDLTLGELSRLGVQWASTRFDKYRIALNEAAGWEFPRPVEEQNVKDLLHESLIQARQLIGLSSMWCRFDEAILVRKLKQVVQGQLLPPLMAHADDLPRNTLLELSTARYLSICEFEVSITDSAADVIAEAAGFRFSVECKRPTGPNSLEKNLKRLKTQLKGRKTAGGPPHGFVVIGIDRLSNVSGASAAVRTYEDLEERVHSGMLRGAEEVQKVARHVGLDVHAALGALVFTAPVWIESQGQPWTVEQTTTFRLSPYHADGVAADAVKPLMTRDFGARPTNFIETP